MTARIRIAAAALLVAGAAGAVALLAKPPAYSEHQPPKPPVTTSAPVRAGTPTGTVPIPPLGPDEGFTAARQCGSCHTEIYGEWATSFHAMAWTDPMVQSLSMGFSMSECIDCHAPLPIHITGVDQRVAPRKRDRSTGVDCISCHLLEDGRSVAAARTVDTSATPGACRPVATPIVQQPAACAGCHNQHETILELEKANIGKTCADCHMEPIERKGGKTGRRHTFPGGHDVAMHRRAAKLEASVEDGFVVVGVTNVGAGHQIPTDARHRSYNVWIQVWDAQGNLLVEPRQIPEAEMRLYYRQDFRPSTQVPHGGTRTSKWRIPEGVKGGKALVRLTYALNPEELGAGRITEVSKVEVTLP